MMIAKAVSKLKTEIESKKDNPYIQVIGGFLLDHLDRNPQDADKIMTDGKTIAKSLDEMRKAASKKKVDNCAVLTDQEGFAIVLKYFGIEHNGAVIVPASAPVMPVPKASSDFDIKLDDLL